MTELIWNEDVQKQVVGMAASAATAGDIEALGFCMKALAGDKAKREALMIAISAGEKITTLMMAVAGVDKKQPEPVKPASPYATPVMVSDHTHGLLFELRHELREAHVHARRPLLENFPHRPTVDALTKAMAALSTLAQVRALLANGPATENTLVAISDLVTP